VLMTTYGGVALAVQALKRGAADFVLKPWRNDALVQVLSVAMTLTAERRASGKALNLDELEKRAIARALKLYEGNVSHAAVALGLTRPALYRRMERHGL
jgi:two-component system response regulator RegA